MVAIKGHVALILPEFTAANDRPLNGASVYEYKGSHNCGYRLHTRIIKL